MSVRNVAKAWKSSPTIEGAGVHLKRAFGFREVPALDPFLLLDDFRNTDPVKYAAGFPWHPHRGIETITYVLDGVVEHGDSMGNKGAISSGDVQWMTAGSGIIHQEMPRGDGDGRMGGFQLWANLPRTHKMMDPRYRDVAAATIPVIRINAGITVRVICGTVNGIAGPVRDIVTDPAYLDITLQPGAIFSHPVDEAHTAFAYVIEGAAFFDRARDAYAHDITGASWFETKRDCLFGEESLVLFERKGNEIEVTTADRGVRFVLVSGRPLNEPVAWYGPIVMNTQEELRVAFDEYERGTFIKKR